MQSPNVAVVIPTRNRLHYLASAINSVDELQSDYENKSIIVVDDGSTDGTFEWIWERLQNRAQGNADGLKGGPQYIGGLWEHKTKLVALRYPKSNGASFARNRGIDIALSESDFKADIIGMLDSDDEWLPGRITECVKAFVENEGVGLVYTDYYIVHENYSIREFKEPFSRERLLQDCIVTNACFIHSEALRNVGGYDEEMEVAEDYDLFLRLSEKYLIYHIPLALANIRSHPGNSTNSVPMEIWKKNWERCANKLKERMNV